MAYLRKGDPIPEKGKGSKLSAKQSLFVDEYFVDLNASAAVLRAGYKTNNPNRVATELLNHPLVLIEIEARQAERRERLELSADYVIHKLIDIVERTDKANPQAALRGLELLGKTLGLYREKQELSGPNGNPIEYEQRIREDTAALEGAIARLAESGGKGNVVSLPVRTAKG